MFFETIFFNFFAILMIIFSIAMVFSKNPLYSILFLVLIFVSTAFLLMILGAEFLSILFIVVYVGAVAVLFLFIVMMLNIKLLDLSKEEGWSMFKLSLVLGLIFFSEIILILKPSFNFNFFNFMVFVQDYYTNNLDYYPGDSWFSSNIDRFMVIYTIYSPLLIMASLVLLVALIGSIKLTLHKRLTYQRQDVNKQLNASEKALLITTKDSWSFLSNYKLSPKLRKFFVTYNNLSAFYLCLDIKSWSNFLVKIERNIIYPGSSFIGSFGAFFKDFKFKLLKK